MKACPSQVRLRQEHMARSSQADYRLDQQHAVMTCMRACGAAADEGVGDAVNLI